MAEIREFQVRKDNLSRNRIAARPQPKLGDGEVLTKVDRFALTANNITYGVVGDRLGYWSFFPAEDGWGIIPVWGFADIVESRHPAVQEGERLYGYFPMGSHAVLRPDGLREDRLFDASAHRADLAPVYNAYSRVAAEPHFEKEMENERMLLMPLYATSFCLYDFLKANDHFGALQIIMPSASSKTAIGLAYALKDDAASPSVIGLTSTRNAATVEALNLYDGVLTYDRIAEIDNGKPTVIVDMSGNGELLSNLHRHLGQNMKYTANVGVTHFDANEMGPHFIRERSAMFFAPGHIKQRAADWGPGVFEKKAFAFWRSAALRSRDWLHIDEISGVDALPAAFESVRAGRVPPDHGLVVNL